MKRKFLAAMSLTVMGLNSYACLLPSYTANYKFSGNADGDITQTLSAENGYTYTSNINAHKLFFKAHIEKSSEGKISASGFETSFFKVKESMHDTEYKAVFEKNNITLNQNNKKYVTKIPKGSKVIGEVVLPLQLRFMLLKNNDMKQTKLNVAFHGKDADIHIIPMTFNVSDGAELKTPLGTYTTKLFTASYNIGEKNIQLKYWFANNNSKLFLQSEFMEDGELKGKAEIKSYQGDDACVVKD